MEAPDGKLKNILKDATFNVMMDISVVNGIIYNKDENVIDDEAYRFQGVIKSWKEAAIRKYYIWVEETYGGGFLLRTDKNIVQLSDIGWKSDTICLFHSNITKNQK